MAERAGHTTGRSALPRARTFGTAAVSAGQQFNWIWSRESLLRLLLSLVLSLALWLYISNRENPNLVQDYPEPLPIAVGTAPQGTTPTSENVGNVYLRIRRDDPNTPVTPASFRVFVDLTNLKLGTHRVPVQVVADPGIEVVGKRPSTVAVTLERKQTRRVPVRVHTLTHPPKGYGSHITWQPKTVVVSGPGDVVSQVQQATAYIDLAGFTSTVSAPYTLSPESSLGRSVKGLLTVKPSEAKVTASIQPFSSYKTLPVLVQFSGVTKQGFGVAGVTVSPAEIAASGSPADLSPVSTVHTSPISVSKRGGGSFQRTVRVELPHGLHTRTHDVKVKVTIAPVQSSTSVEIGIQPQGVSGGLIAHTIPARVLVTVTGPANTLHGVARTTRASVNLRGYRAGVYQLQPRVISSRKRLQVEAIYPRHVTVQLRSNG